MEGMSERMGEVGVGRSGSPFWKGELGEPKCRGDPVGEQIVQAYAGNSSLGFILKSVVSKF